MAFIEKKDPVVLNIKLTSKGREMLSQGKLSFKYYAVGDSEIDYAFNNEVMNIPNQTGHFPFDSNILRPVDNNPRIISFIPKTLSGDSYNTLSSPYSYYQVRNQINSIGFFNNSGDTFIVDSNYVKQPDIMIYMSGITGGRSLKLKKAQTYGTSGEEPVVGDLILIKWTTITDTTGYTTNKTEPRPFLIYQISGVTSGTLGNNNLIITVDRDLPNFSAFTGTTNTKAGAMIFYNYINFTGDTIFNNYSTDYLDDSVISFLQNSECPTVIYPFWNMSIVYTEEIAGVQTGTTEDRKFGQFNTNSYGGFISYIQNQAPTYKKLGIIHYTNSSPANVYAEGFYLNTPKLDIPTIMWHKSATKTLGVTLTAYGSSKLLTGTTTGTSLNTVYYDLADPSGNIVGKIFTDLKIFVIEDQELLFAMSYKSNRSWTLPNYIINNNKITVCP